MSTITKDKRALFFRTLKYLLPYKRHLFFALFCMILFALFNTLSLATLRPIINKGLDEKNLSLLKLLSLALIGLYALKGLTYYGQKVLMALVGGKATIDIRNVLFQHLESFPMSFFTQRKTGHLISRITNDVGMMKDILTVLFGDILREPFSIIGITILLFRIHWGMALVSLIAFPLAVFPIKRFGEKIGKVSKSRQRRRAKVLQVIQESLSGIQVIKAFSRERKMAENFSREQEHSLRLTMKIMRTRALSQPLMELLGAVFFSLLIFWGGKMVISGVLDKGGFFTFIFSLGALYRPVRLVTQTNNRIQASLAGVYRVFEVLDSYSTVRENVNAIELPPFKKEIKYIGVSFSYDSKPVLKDINLSVRKGEKVAIVGPSGVGKTTLTNLLPRFYDPTSGHIEIDGIDIKEVTFDSLRSQIGIVSQETFLFHNTVKANISFGKNSVTDEEIINASKVAYAHDFIMKLPKAYDTVIGERGAKLSGGEKQRISIARAILKNPPILILDEATASLDSESEYLVQKALNELMKDRTVFIIAHRLSTVKNADRIFVLMEGRIVEEGKHEELIKKEGEYFKLYNLQFGE